MKLLKGTYSAKDYAKSFMFQIPNQHLKVRIKPGIKHGWAYFYHKSKKIWSCNLVFFKGHFTKDEVKR